MAITTQPKDFEIVWIEIGRPVSKYLRNNILLNQEMFPNLKRTLVVDRPYSLENCDVNIVHPKYKNKLDFSKNTSISQKKFKGLIEDLEYITIKLKKNQILILPTFWIYHTDCIIDIYILHDTISYIYEIFYKTFYKTFYK